MLYSGPPRSTTSISSLDKRVMRKRAPRRYSAGVLLERASTRSFSKAITLLRRQPRAVSVSALYFALCPFWAPKGPGACGPGPSFFLGARWMGFQSPKEGSGTYVPAVVLTYTVAKECSRPPSRGHVASIHPVS